MPKESKFDAQKLRTLVDQGLSAIAIMAALGITKATLKKHLHKLMNLDEKYYKISGIEGRSLRNEVRFGKFGVRISKTALEGFGITEGEVFRLKVDGSRVILEGVRGAE